MTRLTAAIRDAIIVNAIEHKDFKSKEMAIVQKRADFIERLRIHVLQQFGLTDARIAEIKSEIEAMDKEVSFNGTAFVRVRFDGTNTTWDVNMAGQRRRLRRNGVRGNGAEMFSESQASWNKETYTPHYNEDDFVVRDPAWREELDAIDAEQDKLREDYNTLKSTMLATLSNFTTVEKLLEAWPDVKELIPETLPIAKKPGTNLALSVADLNALCGLPSGE